MRQLLNNFIDEFKYINTIRFHSDMKRKGNSNANYQLFNLDIYNCYKIDIKSDFINCARKFSDEIFIYIFLYR